jgi:hypothetical protein
VILLLLLYRKMLFWTKRCGEVPSLVGLFQVSKSSYENVNLVRHIFLLIVAMDMDFGISQWGFEP